MFKHSILIVTLNIFLLSCGPERDAPVQSSSSSNLPGSPEALHENFGASTQIDAELANLLFPMDIDYASFEHRQNLNLALNELGKLDNSDPTKEEALSAVIANFVDEARYDRALSNTIVNSLVLGGYLETPISELARSKLGELANMEAGDLDSNEILILGLFGIDGYKEVYESVLGERLIKDSGIEPTALIDSWDLTSEEWAALRVAIYNGDQLAANMAIEAIETFGRNQKYKLIQDLRFTKNELIRDYLIDNVFSDEGVNIWGISGAPEYKLAWYAANALQYYFEDFPPIIGATYGINADSDIQAAREWLDTILPLCSATTCK